MFRKIVPGRPSQWRSRKKAAGMTLIEMSIVVALFGVLAIYLAESHLTEWKVWGQNQKIAGAVSDVWGIVDSARAWASENEGAWPNDGAITNPNIQLEQLVDDGYLRAFPESRYYSECNKCGKYYGGDPRPTCCYSITGWNRSLSAPTTSPAVADDLLIRFSAWGKHAANSIAAQVPFGNAMQVGGEEYQVTVRVPTRGNQPCIKAPASSYVRLCGEDRTVKFSRGDLQGVAQITRGKQGVSATGIALQPDEISMGTFATEARPRARLLLRKGPDDVTNTMAALGIASDEGDFHLMKFGVIASCVIPYLSLSGYESDQGFDNIELDAGFLFARAKSGPNTHHPPFWEMFLARRSDTLQHRGLHSRLCALESALEDVSPDCACPATTATSCAVGS